MIWFCMESLQHPPLTITVDRTSKSFGLTNDLLAATAVDSSRLPGHLMQPATVPASKQVICIGKCVVSSAVVIVIATTVTTQACTRRVNGLVVMVKLIWFCVERTHFLVLVTTVTAQAFVLANALPRFDGSTTTICPQYAREN